MNHLPRGLLKLARWIREIKSKEVRRYVYHVWLHDVYPEEYKKYVHSNLVKDGILCDKCGAHKPSWEVK